MEFTREIAKEIVRKALKEVAQFDGEFEHYTFQFFNNFHKTVFMNSIKFLTNQIKNDGQYFDIILDSDLFNRWNTIKDCVEYLASKRQRRILSTDKIKFRGD
jgi:hypothetical protein